MKLKAGLWIDHKKAVIVFVDGKSEKKVIVKSNIEKIIQSSGSLKSFKEYGRKDFPRFDIAARDVKGHLNTYFESVGAFLRGAESVLVLGPGELKKKLVKWMKKSKFPGTVARVITADKMTDPQIAAKVRHFFIKK